MRCPFPGRPSLPAGARGCATRVSRARLVWAWGPSTGPAACALASRRCALWAWREGVPGGGALRRCEGGLSSGALPPPAPRPQGGLSGSATHVLWALVCWRGGPILSLWLSCPARGCVPRGWREGVSGRGALRRCKGGLSSGALPPPAARPQGGLSESATHVLWAQVCGRWGPGLSLWLACPAGGCVPRGAGGRPSRGGWPSTVVRGVWCQALSLPQLPVPWGGQPGFRDPCFPGAVGVGVRTQHRPHSVRSCEPSLRAVGVARGRPRGRALRRCEGRLSSGSLPPHAARPQSGMSGSATHVLWARVCGCGGPALSLWLACPAGCCMPRGWWEAVLGGAAFHCCEARLVSGAVPPPAARPLGRAARVLRPVFPGRSWCGCGDPAPTRRHALLRAVVAHCGGGGRVSLGGVAPGAIVRGRLSLGALALPCLSVRGAGS